MGLGVKQPSCGYNIILGLQNLHFNSSDVSTMHSRDSRLESHGIYPEQYFLTESRLCYSKINVLISVFFWQIYYATKPNIIYSYIHFHLTPKKCLCKGLKGDLKDFQTTSVCTMACNCWYTNQTPTPGVRALKLICSV